MTADHLGSRSLCRVAERGTVDDTSRGLGNEGLGIRNRKETRKSGEPHSTAVRERMPVKLPLFRIPSRPLHAAAPLVNLVIPSAGLLACAHHPPGVQHSISNGSDRSNFKLLKFIISAPGEARAVLTTLNDSFRKSCAM